jgi:deoxyadenosine/deoxycytidine kinase
VSDFWFEQSAAFASVWLPAERFAEYMAHWSELQAQVVRPRLIVLLRAPQEALLARIRSRGRPGEARLTIEQLRRISEALENRAASVDGPLLRLDATDQQSALVELTAAVEAMR